MREKRSFAERTKILQSNEVKKKYFLIFEGKVTEEIYFEALEELKGSMSISPLIEMVPIIRSYSEDGWSNPKKILDRVIKNIEEQKTGRISYETLLNWIMDYLQEDGILGNNRSLSKNFWTIMLQLCKEKLQVSLDDEVEDLKKVSQMILNVLKEETKLDKIIADIPRIIDNGAITFAEGVDRICLIVDRDKDSFTLEQYDYVLEQCQTRNYQLCVSNPCFEFWLLMHFDDVAEIDKECLRENPKTSANRRFCEDELRKRFPRYTKSKYDATELVRHVGKAILNEKLFSEDIKELKVSLGSNVGVLITEMQN